jgi:shikimate kinase
LSFVRRILVTGMSGTGKSTALQELARRGFRTVDTDEGGWTEWRDDDGGGGYYWNEPRMDELLAGVGDAPLFVSGTATNQGRFYPRFDAVVLLSAPVGVLLERIDGRTANPYGKSPEERELILTHVAEVEPLLRATCTHELDATRPLEEVVDDLARLAVG